MKNEEKLQYLNAVLAFNRAVNQCAKNGSKPNPAITDYFSLLPKSLFKYRPFDEYTWDMLENGYLYLCPAEKLDDPFECVFDLDVSQYFDKNKHALKSSMIELVVETVLNFVSEDQRERTRQIAYSCLTPKGTINRRMVLDMALEEQKDKPGFDEKIIVNQIGAILDEMESPKNTYVDTLIKYSIDARKETGIYAMSEINDSQVMWAMYGDNYKGCCIEYDFENDIEASIDTLPVIYQNKRSNNVLNAIMAMLLNSMVNGMSGGRLTTDETQYLQVLLTKSEEWSFQKEWRVVGGAREHVHSPRVKAVYVGHNASKENIELIKELSRKKGFDVYKTSINLKTLKIEFIKVF